MGWKHPRASETKCHMEAVFKRKANVHIDMGIQWHSQFGMMKILGSHMNPLGMMKSHFLNEYQREKLGTLGKVP